MSPQTDPKVDPKMDPKMTLRGMWNLQDLKGLPLKKSCHVFSDFFKHFRKAHFRGLFNSIIVRGGASAMITSLNFLKSMDFKEILDFQ